MINLAGSKGVKSMREGFGEIMTLEETAKYLKIGKSTLYKMAREGKIPAFSLKSRRFEAWEVFGIYEEADFSAVIISV